VQLFDLCGSCFSRVKTQIVEGSPKKENAAVGLPHSKKIAVLHKKNIIKDNRVCQAKSEAGQEKMPT
jgi:copper chaperone CopZ